jgi:HAD superfamily hydrolase (TIGR01509 family)
MDGTLADSIDHYYVMAREVVDMAGAPPVSREWVCELMGSGDPELMRKLLPADFPNVDATIARIVQERYPAWRHSAERIEPLEGCVHLVQRLHEQGCKLGIATSSGRKLPYLDHWGVRDLFDSIIGREDVVQRKPHPEVIIRCLEDLDLEPEDAAYVGDSPIDIEAGRAAGVYTVGVLTGNSSREVLAAVSPDYILGNASELLGILETPGFT